MLLCLICILAFFCFLNVKLEISGCVLRGPGCEKLLPGEMLKMLGRLFRTPKSKENRTGEVPGSARRHSIPYSLLKIFPVAPENVPRYTQVVSPSPLTRSQSLLLPTANLRHPCSKEPKPVCPNYSTPRPYWTHDNTSV